MKKEYRIEGLDCANCAAKVERTIKKSEGVKDASVSFLRGLIKVEWLDDYEKATASTLDSIIRRVESGVKVTEIFRDYANNSSENAFQSTSQKTLNTNQNVHSHEANSCDCAHDHSHEHNSCDCGHDHSHDHNSCDCGHDHSHDHNSCDCGHDHSHDHNSCDCGHDHSHDHNSCDCGHDHSHEQVVHETSFSSNSNEEQGNTNKKTKIISPEKLSYIRLIVGALVFALGLILEHVFRLDSYIYISVFALGFLILGGDVLLKAVKNIIRGQVFDENFLMVIATVGAFIIGEYAEGVGVMLFYQVGEMFQEMAVRRAKKSITSLMDIRPDFANIYQNNQLVKVSPYLVKIGDTIIVRPGEKIPLDGDVISGESMLDTAALTGESVPRKATAGDSVLSGSVNLRGLLTIKVTQIFSESTVSKIIDLVENATEKKAPTEKFITKFARFYTPIVVVLALIISVIPPLFIAISDLSVWMDWARRGLIFLVISCPCALVISIPLGFFGGIGGASKKGVLIKGGGFLEALNHIEIAVFDKTGTLTKGVFNVTNIIPNKNYTNDDVLSSAAKAEVFSTHPIAQSILRAYGTEVDKTKLTDYNEVAGHGISVNDDGRIILAGNEKLMRKYDISFIENKIVGTKVYVAADGEYLGVIVISDEIKDDAREFILSLKQRSVRTVMLTGDNEEIAKDIATKLGIDEYYGGLLPHEKVEKVEELSKQKSHKGKLVFMGDGINDAPVLALSDIGVSMGGLGSDAAIEAADIVIMTDEPSKLDCALDTAKFTRRIVWQNIICALGIKAIFLVLGAFGLTTMWEAVFADVGVALLAILNALRIMRKR